MSPVNRKELCYCHCSRPAKATTRQATCHAKRRRQATRRDLKGGMPGRYKVPGRTAQMSAMLSPVLPFPVGE